MAGISASFLSAIERGRETAALKTLRAIASSLDLPLFAILSGGEDNSTALNRAADRPRLKFSDSLVEYEVLLLDASRDAQVYIGHLAPGVANTSNPVGHGAPSHECLFILSGRVTVRLKDKILALGKSDCLNFDGEIPHQIIADKSGPASFLSITTGTFIAWRKLAPSGKSRKKGKKAAADATP